MIITPSNYYPSVWGEVGDGYLVPNISSIGAVAVYCCASRWKKLLRFDIEGY